MKYFIPSEFSNIEKLDDRLLELIDEFREFVGKPIHIHSDYREGDGTSQHHLGKAFDIHIQGFDVLDQYLLAEKFDKFTGIGIYPCWNRPGIHVDIRYGAPARWLAYKDNGKQVYTALNSENIRRYVIPLI
jgi:uncharacterized protein YcbK (DUF882 family)